MLNPTAMTNYLSILLFLAYFCAVVSFCCLLSPDGLPNTWALYSIGLLMFIQTHTKKAGKNA